MGYDNEHHMPPPDWNRVLVNTAHKTMAVGDPRLWGNSVTTLIDDDPAVVGTVREIASEQILLANSADNYARSWSLSGTLAVKAQGWVSLPGSAPDGINPPTEGMNVFLSVVQGVGKISIEHQINLACNGAGTNIGLCWNQSTENGGPYVPLFRPLPLGADTAVVLPFALMGSIIANSVSVRAIYVRGAPSLGITISRATMTCLLTPIAAGTGL